MNLNFKNKNFLKLTRNNNNTNFINKIKKLNSYKNKIKSNYSDYLQNKSNSLFLINGKFKYLNNLNNNKYKQILNFKNNKKLNKFKSQNIIINYVKILRI